MRQSFLSALVLSFSALARATVTSPAAGDSWPVEQNQMITWDTTGLQAPLNIHLVPSGAVDATVIIAEIAVNVGNTGSFQWAPPNTITVTDVEIIIIDAKQTIVISEVFIIIILEKTTTKKLTTMPTKTSTKLSTITKLATVTTKPTTQLITQTLVKTSTLTTLKVNTTTIKPTLLTTSKSLTLPAILMTTTKPMTSTTTKPLTTSITTKPLTTSSIKLGTAVTTPTKSMNSTMLLKATGTAAVASAKATFTGVGSHISVPYTISLLSGGLVGLLAVFFL